MTFANDEARIAAEIVGAQDGSDPFAAAVRATRMPMVISDPRLPDNPIVFVNDAFLKLTGYERAEILGRNCRFLQGPSTERDAVSQIRAAIEKRETIEIDLINHRKDGSVFWNRALISPVFDEKGELSYFFASQFDVTLEKDRLVRLEHDRDTLEEQVALRAAELTRSEDRLRFTLEAGRLGPWSIDVPVMRLDASDDCKINFGREPTDPFTFDDFLASVSSADRDRVQRAISTAVAEGTDYDIEYRIELDDGEVRWIHARGQTFYDADRTPDTMSGITLDITERKRAEEHRALLANELTHRVKNTLATIQAIVNQTLRSASSLEAARHTLESRLVSLAAAHDALTQEAWEGATLSEIIAKAVAPFQTGNASRFRTDGPAIRLPPRSALAVSMALHELATNAVKYGALSNEVGHVVLTWTLVEEDGVEQMVLHWQEIGGPPVTPPTRKGFGSRMIERALAQEIEGRVEIAYRPDGVVFTAKAPVPRPGCEGTGVAAPTNI